MSRLYDRLMRNTKGRPVTLHSSAASGRAYSFGEDVPVVIKAQNVAEYYLQREKESAWDIAKDMPILAPPWEFFFVEWRDRDYGLDIGFAFVATDLSQEEDYILDNRGEVLGHVRDYTRLARAYSGAKLRKIIEAGPDERETLSEKDRLMGHEYVGYLALENALEYGDDEAVSKVIREMNGDVRWFLDAHMFAELSGKSTVCPLHKWSFAVYPNGGVPVGGDGTAIFRHGPADARSPEEHAQFMTERRSLVKPALLCISFLHCKNVAPISHEPPSKVQAKALRKHGRSLTKYYTLQIEPLTGSTRTGNGSSSATSISRALHIARGHFATYSPDKPLFGKYAGTFWKPQHVRGSKAHGEVVKDYAVNAPRRQESAS